MYRPKSDNTNLQGLLSYKRRMNPEADALVFESLALEFGVEQREVPERVAGAPLRGDHST